MSRIILIETSASRCSTAICDGDGIVARRCSDEPRRQASLTALFVKEMLDEAHLSVADCDAVCVSSGPGSYTGLRVGVSTAKGLCFASGKPLLSLCTLDILARQAVEGGLLPRECRYIVPMIDARRMEVYTAVYDAKTLERTGDVKACIVEPDSFSTLRGCGSVLFIGDGAPKCEGTLDLPDAVFVDANPDATAMRRDAVSLFESGSFENVAYFEPFYLKQFTATVSKKKLF